MYAAALQPGGAGVIHSKSVPGRSLGAASKIEEKLQKAGPRARNEKREGPTNRGRKKIMGKARSVHEIPDVVDRELRRWDRIISSELLAHQGHLGLDLSG